MARRSIRGCRQVVIDPDGAWNEPTSTADLIARADPVALLSAFAAAARRRARTVRGWRAGWPRPRRPRQRVDAFLDTLGDELFEPRVHRDLSALLPAAQHRVRRLQHAGPRPRDVPAEQRPAELRFLANRGANGIDGLVSSGLGAAAVAPGAPSC